MVWHFWGICIIIVMPTSQLPTPVIGNKAYQPHTFQFPQHKFGKTSIVKRSFQRQWFNHWFWHRPRPCFLLFMHHCLPKYRIRGLFGGNSNLVVWQIFVGSPNLNYIILKWFNLRICVAHGWANSFIMATTSEESQSVYCEAVIYHFSSCNMHI